MNLYNNKEKETNLNRKETAPRPFPIFYIASWMCPEAFVRQTVRYAERTDSNSKYQTKANLVQIHTQAICVAPRGNERLLFQDG